MIVDALARIFGATSVDIGNPKDPAIAKMFGFGRESVSGTVVTNETVLALPAVLRAINIISNAMMKLPWYVFKENADGREFDRTHPSWTAVTRKPNAEFTIGPLKKTMTAWAMGWGNACCYIDRKNWPNGPVELIPLLPDRTKLVRYKGGGYSTNVDTDEGILLYATEIGGEKFTFEADKVFHLRGLGGSPYWGYNVVDILRETFGGSLATAEFGHRFFGQGANPAGFIESPVGLDEESEETFMESLKKASSGLGKSHKFILLEEGAKFHQITIDPQKSQLLETKTLDVRMLAMAIGIKVHKLIDGSNTAFASLEQANQEHKDDDLMPWICAFREECNDKLLTEQQKESGSHCIDVDDEQLEWVPFQERSKGTVELYNNGLIDKEEGRRKMNFGPSGSPHGRKYRIPANIGFEGETAVTSTPSGAADPASQPTDPPNDNQDDPSAAKLLAVSSAFLDKIRARLCKQAEAKSKSSKEFLPWLDALATEEGPEPIQAAVDGLYVDLKTRWSKCCDTATTDEELRAMISESVVTIQSEKISCYLEA